MPGVSLYPAFRDEAPHKKHQNGPRDSTAEPSTLVWRIPPKRLAEATRNECTDDLKDCRQHETARLVHVGPDEFGDHAKVLEPDKEDLSTRPIVLASSSLCTSSCAIVARSGSCSGFFSTCMDCSACIFANDCSIAKIVFRHLTAINAMDFNERTN